MPRLFTGLALPDDIRMRLAALKAPLPGAKWVDPSDLHVTLRFAGDIDNRTAREFTDGLARIDVDCFEIRLAGLGVFGGNDPHALWVGVEAPPELDSLMRANERAARNAGLKPETRSYRPHVTVARIRNGRIDPLARYLQRHGAFRLPPFLVTEFVLFSSKPGVGGGPYVTEARFPLSGAYGFGDGEADADAW